MPYIYCIGSQPHRPLVNRLSLLLRYAGSDPSVLCRRFWLPHIARQATASPPWQQTHGGRTFIKPTSNQNVNIIHIAGKYSCSFTLLLLCGQITTQRVCNYTPAPILPHAPRRLYRKHHRQWGPPHGCPASNSGGPLHSLHFPHFLPASFRLLSLHRSFRLCFLH